MRKEIFSDPEYNEDLAICLHKMTSDNKSFAALREARTKAFVTQYMADPEWSWKFKERDMKAANNLSFPDWLKTVDVRDYLIKSDLSDKLLEDMSANEVKIILADEMRLYYDAFREDAGHPASEGKENSDYDGDFREKLKSSNSSKSGKNFIDFMNEMANNRHKEENKEKTPNKNKEDHDEDEDWKKFINALNEDDDEDENLEKIINAIAKGLGKLSEISESLDKKEGKNKNENKGN